MVRNVKRPALKPTTMSSIIEDVAWGLMTRIPPLRVIREVEADGVESDTPNPHQVLRSMTRARRREEFRREMKKMKTEDET